MTKLKPGDCLYSQKMTEYRIDKVGNKYAYSGRNKIEAKTMLLIDYGGTTQLYTRDEAERINEGETLFFQVYKRIAPHYTFVQSGLTIEQLREIAKVLNVKTK